MCWQLVNAGEDVLIFYNDRASFQILVQMMRSERDRMDENSPLMYHIHLVELLAVCTEGKNVYTEIKCNSLLPLDDIVRVSTHEDCIPEVSGLSGFLLFWCGLYITNVHFDTGTVAELMGRVVLYWGMILLPSFYCSGKCFSFQVPLLSAKDGGCKT